MCQPDWGALTGSLLERTLLASLGSGRPPLQFKGFLLPQSTEWIAATKQQAALLALSLVCRQWRAAVQAVVEQATWSVTVQAPATAAVLVRLDARPVERLDLRRLTWSETDCLSTAEALLGSPAFLQQSAPTLRHMLGVPERCAASLVPFSRLESVGLCEDYVSTSGKPHGASMDLVPLEVLPSLRCLQLELGIVELGTVPRRVTELQLVEVDRIVLPPAPGASVADRLLAVAETHGLTRLSLQAASGSLVFEEDSHTPLELELSHVARLLAAHDSRWCIVLGVQRDEAVQVQAPRLDLSRVASQPPS